MTRKSSKHRHLHTNRTSRTEATMKGNDAQKLMAIQSPLEAVAERMLDPYWAWRTVRG